MSDRLILTEVRDRVGLIRLNRPQARNALCAALIGELRRALDVFEADDTIGAIVVTGTEFGFAAGGDIKEMSSLGSLDQAYLQEFNAGDWLRLSTCRKPTIAAVAGYAFGGGCELAMMCDFILAADTAKFGQLEVTLGLVPGGGGTQRLPRLVGKSKAMEMCLSGRLMDAVEAERAGMVSRIIPAAGLLEEALRTAASIANLSRPVVMMIKECVGRAYEMPLAEGLLFERRMSHAAFGLDDGREGMRAFAEKRPAVFNTRLRRSEQQGLHREDI
jgi:enoyl-CoA hydratase